MIPLIILIIPLIGYIRGVKIYEAFVEGASEGFQTSIKIMPYLIAMLVAINIFRLSGAMNAIISFLNPIFTFLLIPPDIMPLAIMRPLSGSGSLGLVVELMSIYGPDSYIGRAAATILASSDTTLYILTVYFGAVGIKRFSYALLVGLTGDIISLVLSIYVCKILFT